MVELEHRHLDRFGVRAAEMRAIFDSDGLPGADPERLAQLDFTVLDA